VVDGLPRNSRYAEAVSQDDELAEALVDKDDLVPVGPRVSEFTPEVEMLTAIFDRLGELGQIFAASRGGKAGRVQPAPRPRTARDRVARRRREKKHRSLVARLLPHKANPPSS